MSARTMTLIASFRAKPGNEERLRAELSAMVEPTLAEMGCLAYRPYIDPASPDRMILLEEWVDETALQAHFKTPHFLRVADALAGILAEPFTLRRFSDVSEAGA